MLTGPSLGGILLAAGRSRRLGQAKQKVTFGGETLLDRAYRQLRSVSCPAVAVLGADMQASPSLDQIVINVSPASGMGRSLKLGLAALLEHRTDLDGVMVTLVDQYRITSRTLEVLAETWRSAPSKVVASNFSGTLGPPALFPATQFARLGQVQDESGAKALLQHAAKADQLVTCAVPAAAYDLDTPADLRVLREFENTAESNERRS